MRSKRKCVVLVLVAEKGWQEGWCRPLSCRVRPFYGNLVKRAMARAHRKNPTPAEAKAWQVLRNRRLFGLKFRRQHPIAGFLVDFCCEELKVVVEIDGEMHSFRHHHDADAERTAAIARRGYRVLRVQNDDVSEELLRQLVSPFVLLSRRERR